MAGAWARNPSSPSTCGRECARGWAGEASAASETGPSEEPPQGWGPATPRGRWPTRSALPGQVPGVPPPAPGTPGAAGSGCSLRLLETRETGGPRVPGAAPPSGRGLGSALPCPPKPPPASPAEQGGCSPSTTSKGPQVRHAGEREGRRWIGIKGGKLKKALKGAKKTLIKSIPGFCFTSFFPSQNAFRAVFSLEPPLRIMTDPAASPCDEGKGPRGLGSPSLRPSSQASLAAGLRCRPQRHSQRRRTKVSLEHGPRGSENSPAAAERGNYRHTSLPGTVTFSGPWPAPCDPAPAAAGQSFPAGGFLQGTAAQLLPARGGPHASIGVGPGGSCRLLGPQKPRAVTPRGGEGGEGGFLVLDLGITCARKCTFLLWVIKLLIKLRRGPVSLEISLSLSLTPNKV